MLEATGGMRAFVFQVKLDTGNADRGKRIRCVSAERWWSALISLMAFLTQLLLIINIHLSFCAKSSEKYGKNCCYLTFKLQCKEKNILYGVGMLDKIDRKLLCLLQQDCTLSLQALADAVNLTTTPCWKRLKRPEDDGILLGRVALLDPEKLGLGLTAFVLIKTQHHSSEWYCRFVTVVSEMPEVLGFWRMAGNTTI